MSSKDRRTKYKEKQQGKCGKVEEEDNLKDQSGDGEDLQENVVADAECTIKGEGGDNRPR